MSEFEELFGMSAEEITEQAKDVMTELYDDKHLVDEATSSTVFEDEFSVVVSPSIAAILSTIDSALGGGNMLVTLLLGSMVPYIADLCKVCYLIGWRGGKLREIVKGLDLGGDDESKD